MAIQVSIAESANAHRLTVRPIICIRNRGVEKGSRIGGVPVLDAKSIGRYMARLPSVLSITDIASIAQLLDYALPPFLRR
jgi:FlaA1/EpsC-like NDP-sugar epimerase